MDKEEFDVLVKQLKEQGLEDEQILGIFIETFETKQCDIEDLEIMFDWMGYNLTDDFYKSHNLTTPPKS